MQDNPTPRINIDSYAILLAYAASLRSEDPYRKVGSCALSHDNRVIGLAYNGLMAKKNVGPEFWSNRDERLKFCIHSEQNLCSLFRRGEAKTVAVTCMPCSSCSNLLISYGVKRILYAEEYHRDSSAIEICKFNDIELIKVERPKWPFQDVDTNKAGV